MCEMIKQIPNLICIFRTALAVWLALAILKNPDKTSLLYFAFVLTWIIIILDGVDGIIARKLNITSDFGAFFDIACDRATELIFLSLFATLRWIPFWVLIVFLIRGIIVDGIRGFASKEGKTAFGEKSMMESKLGLFLTSSRFMRFTYGAIKALAFSFMFIAQLPLMDTFGLIDYEMILVYLATFLCVIRGIPVLIEGKRFFS